MNRASSSREVRVGLVIVAGLAGLLTLLVLAGGGPGYLVLSRTEVDVVFRDGQGIRAGQPVRVAGLDVGRVSTVDLIEHEGSLRARVRMSIPSDLASRLRQDAVIVIQTGLTGQSHVNVASIGESGVAWVPGQVVEGVESSLFDPILEEVGLGPVERGHLSHTIAQVRQTVDEVGPRLQKILASAQQAAADAQAMAESARPAVASSAEKLERIAPRVESAVERAEALVGNLDEAVEENRPVVERTLANVEEISGESRTLVAEAGPEVKELIEGLDETRKRADQFLYHADKAAEEAGQSVTQVNAIVTQNRADLVRTIANVRDATDYARMLVQKIYANPFLISPLHRPSREDIAAQTNFDTAQEFLKAAQEFHDALEKLQAMRDQPLSPQEQQALGALFQHAQQSYSRLFQTSQQLADGVQQAGGVRQGGRRD